MRAVGPFLYLALFCLCSIVVIHFGIFDEIHDSANHSLEKTEIHLYVILFFVGTSVYRIADGWRLCSTKKITQFDLYFLIVHNGFALIQLLASGILYTSFLGKQADKTMIKQAMLLSDWSFLPFFSWIIVWSRHVRRGWNVKHNVAAFVISTFSYFLCLAHRSSFYFLLGIAVVLSSIALYETYKTHFYRPQVTPLFFSLMCLHAVFYISCCWRFFELSLTSRWTYVFMTSFLLITSLTNRIHLRILIEVNEYKH